MLLCTSFGIGIRDILFIIQFLYQVLVYLLLLESLYLLVRVVWRLRDDTLSFSISSPLLALLLLWINTALSSLLILTR